MASLPKILIFSSAEKSYSSEINDDFVAELNRRMDGDGRVEWHNYRDIRLEFGSNTLAAFIQSTGESLDTFAFVYFKSFFRNSEQAAAIAAYLDTVHVPFVCTELRQHVAFTKLTQFSRLAAAGVPMAETIYLDPSHFLEGYDYVRRKLGEPFIFKSTDGRGGNDNYLIHSRDELRQALAKSPDLKFVAQRFIDNSSDLRILIIDRQIKLIIERRRQGDSHLNNTSKGASASLMPLQQLSYEHQSLVLQAAALMNRETAGVDLVFETGTGHPYVLEVNASPQIGSGAFVDEKLEIYSQYLRNMLK